VVSLLVIAYLAAVLERKGHSVGNHKTFRGETRFSGT